MEIVTQNHKRDPNQKVQALWTGIASGNRTVTTVWKPSADRNSLEATRVYGPAMPRGQGGRIGVLVLGGMETSLDEVEAIAEAARAKKFKARRSMGEIASMCRMVADMRNEAIMDARKRAPTPRPRRPSRRLYLPTGCRYVPTSEPGLKILVRA